MLNVYYEWVVKNYDLKMPKFGLKPKPIYEFISKVTRHRALSLCGKSHMFNVHILMIYTSHFDEI